MSGRCPPVPNDAILQGQLVFLRAYLTDPSTPGCDPNDPATQDPLNDTTLESIVYQPDGTIVIPAPTFVNEATGTYSADFTPTQSG